MKLIHILVLTLLTIFALTQITNLSYAEDEGEEAKQKRIQSVKEELIELKSKSEYAFLINDMLEN